MSITSDDSLFASCLFLENKLSIIIARLCLSNLSVLHADFAGEVYINFTLLTFFFSSSGRH